MSLGHKVKQGTIWISVSQAMIKIFGLAAQVILARMLLPEDFGVIAIAIMFLQALRQFGSFGFTAAVIHHQKDIDNYANAAFWMSLTIFTGLTIVSWIISPLVAYYYENLSLSPILRVLSLGFVFEALCSLPNILLTKELQFKKVSLIEIGVGMINKTVTIVMALKGYGVWALVIPEILAYPVKLVLLWRGCPWRPKWTVNFDYCWSIFHYGKHILGTNIVKYLNANIDYMIIGKILGTVMLGYYAFAYNLANWIITEFIFVIIMVAFPAFSKIQRDPVALKEVFLKIIKAQSLLAWPLFAGIIVTAQELIPFVYGEKWLTSILPLQILTLAAIIRSLSAIGAQAIKALGKPEVEFKFNVYIFIAMVVTILIGTRYGIIGTAIAVTLSTGIGYLIFFLVVLKDLDIHPREIYAALKSSLWNSALMVLGVVSLRLYLLQMNFPRYQILFLSIFAGALIFILGLTTFFREDFNWFYRLVFRRQALADNKNA